MVHLGCPVEGPIPGWMLTVRVSVDKAGRDQFLPVTFSEQQAREIARRIVAYYGPVQSEGT